MEFCDFAVSLKRKLDYQILPSTFRLNRFTIHRPFKDFNRPCQQHFSHIVFNKQCDVCMRTSSCFFAIKAFSAATTKMKTLENDKKKRKQNMTRATTNHYVISSNNKQHNSVQVLWWKWTMKDVKKHGTKKIYVRLNVT